MAKAHVIQIEDVVEAFNGLRRKNMVRLSDKEPELASEWCFEKNCGWGPEDFSHASVTRAWWKCPYCLRTYKTKINNRTCNGSGCPYCASKLVCEDNGLVDHYPELVTEWHPTKNGKMKASDFTQFSGKRAWWLCGQCSHEWHTVISERTLLEAGCPACYQTDLQDKREQPKPPRKREKRILNNAGIEVSRAWYEAGRIKFEPLTKTHPKLAKQWHPVKNGEFKAKDFTYGSETIAWWRCTKEPSHEWQAMIYSRSKSQKAPCPICKGYTITETNNLAKQFPQIAKEWHPTKNGKLRPTDVNSHTGKKVWWLCRKNPTHEWQTSSSLRTAGRKCHFCTHTKIHKETSILKDYAYIAAQLHPTKNGALKPETIGPGSSLKLWWRCPKNKEHDWQATVANRIGRGSGCPYCTGKRVTKSNSLAGLRPDLIEQWDYKKNKEIDPEQVSLMSSRKVWWRCNEGHTWQQVIERRSKTDGACYECRTGKARPSAKLALKLNCLC